VEDRPVLAYDVRGLEVALDGRQVLGPLDLRIPRGAFMGVLGPNGSGKTTLLRALSGVAKPKAGQILLAGSPIAGYRATEVARLVGVVPQQFSLDFGFTVAEMVTMGRYAHGGRHPRLPVETLQAAGTVADAGAQTAGPAADEAAVQAALTETGLSDLAGRQVTQLSGGERQRALVAQTLAQESPILLLDEPLNNLDLNHQLEVMQLLRRLNEAGRTIVVVLHDLNIAGQYCEQIVLLDGGKIAAQGSPADILDPKVILDVFRVRVAVHHQGLRPYITPLWTNTHQAAGEGGALKVHVMAGGGAASALVEELVLHGFTPSVGVVSVFDTDYVTAGRYELEVVSAPPFQPFPAQAVEGMDALVRASAILLVAPVFFAPGNMGLLHVALKAARRGQPVVFLEAGSMEQRDLAGGEAVALVEESLAAGALAVETVAEAVDQVRKAAAGQQPLSLTR
jgi:iron complex transport system ATP-binding protein